VLAVGNSVKTWPAALDWHAARLAGGSTGTGRDTIEFKWPAIGRDVSCRSSFDANAKGVYRDGGLAYV